MELTEIVELVSKFVSTTGFPIAACIAMFWYNVKIVQPLVEVLNRIEAKLDN